MTDPERLPDTPVRLDPLTPHDHRTLLRAYGTYWLVGLVCVAIFAAAALTFTGGHDG